MKDLYTLANKKHLPLKRIKYCIQNSDSDPNIKLIKNGEKTTLFKEIIKTYAKNNMEHVYFFIKHGATIDIKFLAWLKDFPDIDIYYKISIIMYAAKINMLSFNEYKNVYDIITTGCYCKWKRCFCINNPNLFEREKHIKKLNEITKYRYAENYTFLMCWNRGRNIEDNLLYYMPRDIMKIIYYYIRRD